ncbi:hypothetical protein MSAN_00905400 [Mycena sanguinolenta]|uniref:Uncharacterized protein n=1 Tax=Mycena sanguinolenta TaxID=230812 RepID=A0A8H6YWG7_9AGAR|nr:hypothetical protein MSAN_00905400 [Mycena sanguinolenta]
MPAISGESFPIFASQLPRNILLPLLVATAILTAIYHMLPLRLAKILDAVMAETSKAYDKAHKKGLRSPTETEMDALREEVHSLVEETRRNSYSWRAALYVFVRGRPFILLYRIHEVKGVKDRITISRNSLSYALKTI